MKENRGNAGMALTNAEMIGKNILELLDSVRAIRYNSGGRDITSVTLPQLKLLRVSAKNPDGVRQKDLAAELKLTPSTVSITIDLMVKQGLLKRTAAADDRRAVTIRLTLKGRRCLESRIRFWNSMMENLLRDIPAAGQDQFITVFEKINANLRKQAADDLS